MNSAALEETAKQLLGLERPVEDWCYNGWQVEPTAPLTRIASAVTASQAMIDAAIAAQAQILVVHHGIFWGSGIGRLGGPLQHRVQSLLGAGCGLLAYHLPLDAQPQWGNNALALHKLGLPLGEACAPYKGTPLGRICWWQGTLADLQARCERVFAHSVLHCPGGPETVHKVAIVTGGGADTLNECADAGAEVLITGEGSERTWHDAAERGIHVLLCGHHATERFAVHVLAEKIAAAHGLSHIALDEANPL